MLLKSIYIKTTNDKFDDYKKSDFFKFGEINYKIFKTNKLSIYLDYETTKEQIEYNSKILEEETKSNVLQKSFLGKEYDFYCYCKSEVSIS